MCRSIVRIVRGTPLVRPSTPYLCSGALAALLLFAGALPVHAQGSGSIVGSAVQEESGRPLVGAGVRIADTPLFTTTDQRGEFRLARVPAGTWTLEVSYLGRETVTRPIALASGDRQAVRVALGVSPVALEGIEALGVRAMSQARALSVQRNAPNIINVVAADQMGRFPDASAPEALQRVPGLAVQRDQGEGRYVLIRGGAPEFTAITLDGATVPSPEGDDRRIALDAVPIDILESLEITKAITPDMDASAIGGTVNLVTRRAPSGGLASLEVAGGYAPIREEPAWKGALDFGRRFGTDGAFGVLVSGSWSRREFGSDDIEPEFDFGDPGPDDDDLVEFQTRHYTLERRRAGGTVSLDYRSPGGSEVELSGTYAEHRDTEQRRILNHVIEDGELEFAHKNRREDLEIGSVALRGLQVIGGGVALEYGASASRSAEDTPFDDEIFFLREGVDFSPDMTDPDRIRPNPSAGALSGPFAFAEIEEASSRTVDRDLIGFLKLSAPYTLGDAAGTIKLGLQVRDKSKDREIVELASDLADDGPDIVLGSDIGVGFSSDGFNLGDYPFPGSTTTPSEVLGFSTRFAARLDGEADVEAETEEYDLGERVTAAFVMTELDLTPRLLLLPGVRYEHTDFEGDGFEFDPDTETLTPGHSENGYSNVFPMVHLRYRVGDRTNLRAAYTTAIARPGFFRLIPYRIRDDEDLELGNPDLSPTTARAADLLVEHYDDRIGLLSAGLFAKWLEDPIFTFVSDNTLGGETERPANGESGWIRGVELALQQQLTFLPGALAGLGVFANYTFADSEGTLPGGRTATLLGQADHVVNAALSFERSGFSSQLSLNYRAAYVDEYGEEVAEDIFVGARHQLDLSASYLALGSGTIFLEVLNLTNQPFVLWQGNENRPRQIEYYEAWGQIGFRVTR